MEVIFYSFQSYDDKGTFAELTLPFRINISELTINIDIFSRATEPFRNSQVTEE